MYEQLKAKGTLPESDQEDLLFSCTCLVGQTKVLDPEVYPIIKEPVGQFFTILGEKRPYSVSFVQHHWAINTKGKKKRKTFWIGMLTYTYASTRYLVGHLYNGPKYFELDGVPLFTTANEQGGRGATHQERG